MHSSAVRKLLLCAIIALFAIRNLPWHLDNFDQAKQAYTSFEIVTQGHWWFQHTPAQNVATKPPLAGWISAALFYVTRWWDGAWRIPSFASALVLLLVLTRVGDRLWAGVGGLLAAGMFGLNLMTPRLATLVRTDMMLTLFIFFTGFLIYEKIRTGSPWTPRERWTIFLLVLASMITKGPIAYAFLLPGLAAFSWICRRDDQPANAWSGSWTWFAPLLVFLAWAGIGMWRDQDFYEQVVLKEFLGRFTIGEQAVHKNQPVYFYVTHVLRDFAPWSVLFVAIPFFKDVRRGIRANRAAVWLVCWSLGGLAVMSFVPSKRPDRIFPIIPPLCLLLVHLMREFQNRGRPTQRIISSAVWLALAVSGGYTVFNIVDGYRGHAGALANFGARVREKAVRNGIRYAIAASKDEGMLLYLRTPVFTKWRDAQTLWRDGKIDALVVNESDFKKNAPLLQPWSLADASGAAEEKNSQYYFIVKPPGEPR